MAVIPWTPPGNSTHMPQTLALVTEDSTNVTRLELLFQVKLHAMKPTTLSCFDHTFIYHPHQNSTLIVTYILTNELDRTLDILSWPLHVTLFSHAIEGEANAHCTTVRQVQREI